MSDRMVTQIEGEITNATKMNEKFRLQFALGIQQTQAGAQDKALNTFAGAGAVWRNSFDRLMSSIV